MKKKELCIRLDPDLLERLEALARDLGKPPEYLLHTALEKYLRDCDANAAE